MRAAIEWDGEESNRQPALPAPPPPGPCQECRQAARCSAQLLACAAFSMFVSGQGELRWRLAPRAPVRSRYLTMFGE